MKQSAADGKTNNSSDSSSKLDIDNNNIIIFNYNNNKKINQYYSFNYKNVYFLTLSTEISYEEESQLYQFTRHDLEQYSDDLP